MQERLTWLKCLLTGSVETSLASKLSVAVAGVVFILCAGLLFNRFAHRDFLGKQTRLIHECKRNPNIDPVRCADLLSARGSKPTVNESSFRDASLRRGFQLIPDDELKQHRRTPKR